MYTAVLMVALSGGTELPDFGHHRRGCHGCYGCSGYSGCCGGSYGCCGGGRHHRRHRGCHGCCGGSYGCCGGYAASGCCGGYAPASYGCCGGTVVTPEQPKKEKLPQPNKTSIEETSIEAPANISIELPAEARLTINGRATKSVSAKRRFITPVLTPDREFYYNVKAEIVRDGQRIVSTQKVIVRAGKETRVRFDFTPSQVALSR